MLDVALLGTGGMMPLPKRFLTSLMCRLNGKLMMIDCGEGTQVTLKLLGWGFKNIDIICFTHYHADHISGLPGILLTIGNSGRTEPLTLIGPKGLVNIYKGLSTIAPELPFKVECVEIPDEEIFSFNFGDFFIEAIQVDHKITCRAYNIIVKRKGKFDVLKAQKNNVPKEVWSLLQKNDSVEFNEKIYLSSMVLGEARKGIKVSYCTDTRPIEALKSFIKDADLFICEGMYGEEEKFEKAVERKHMIFSEAAALAKAANVNELWLTHFSPSLAEPEVFLENASRIFPNTVIGYDRINKTILFEN